MNLMKYDLIILDCDGVIFNSNLLKIEAFKVSLEDFDNKAVLSFIEYLKKNFGSGSSELPPQALKKPARGCRLPQEVRLGKARSSSGPVFPYSFSQIVVFLDLGS